MSDRTVTARDEPTLTLDKPGLSRLDVAVQGVPTIDRERPTTATREDGTPGLRTPGSLATRRLTMLLLAALCLWSSTASAAIADRSLSEHSVARAPTSSVPGMRAAGDTLIPPFTVGMSLVEIDTLAATKRLRWLGRAIDYAGDSTLSLYELRDTNVRGMLIYSLTLDRGGLRQVELHRNVPSQEAAAFGLWLVGILRAVAATPEPSSLDAQVRTFCREGIDGAAISTRLLVRDGDHATMVVCAGKPCVAYQRP